MNFFFLFLLRTKGPKAAKQGRHSPEPLTPSIEAFLAPPSVLIKMKIAQHVLAIPQLHYFPHWHVFFIKSYRITISAKILLMLLTVLIGQGVWIFFLALYLLKA